MFIELNAPIDRSQLISMRIDEMTIQSIDYVMSKLDLSHA
jgi:hypothetical protein